MTGPFHQTSQVKKKRIKQLTQEGLSAPIIAERLGLKFTQVYYSQVKYGLRKVKNGGNYLEKIKKNDIF